jgi:hypothetical protein
MESRLLALGIFTSYFLIIIGLFCLILLTLPNSPNRNGTRIAVYTFGFLALISFAHTWYCELRIDALPVYYNLMNGGRYVRLYEGRYLSIVHNRSSLTLSQWSFHDYEQSLSTQSGDFYERLTNWLRGTELFEQAWKIVCAGPLNWWWSEQLCLFTVGAWTVFLSVQGQSYKSNVPSLLTML